MAKGYVDNDVIEDLQSLVDKLEKKTGRKKKQLPKGNMNPISSYFHEKASTSHRKFQDGSNADSHDDDDDDDDGDDDSDDDEDDNEDDDDDDGSDDGNHDGDNNSD